MQPAGLLWNRRGWLAGAAGQTIQPHLESFTWIVCVCLCLCMCVWLLCWAGVSPVAALLHHVPESAVGKETRERERETWEASQGAQFRVRARRNGEEKADKWEGKNKSRGSWKRVVGALAAMGGWLEGINRGEAKSMWQCDPCLPLTSFITVPPAARQQKALSLSQVAWQWRTVLEREREKDRRAVRKEGERVAVETGRRGTRKGWFKSWG